MTFAHERRAKAWGATVAALLVALSPARARAQACCAGGSAVTPGRLEAHETALVGISAKAATVFGSYDPGGRYVASPAGDDELDLEQDAFAAVRFLRRAQAALLVPFVETRRSTPALGAQTGAGVGDVNGSARYDFVLAGESAVIPGIAALAGLTVPTGRAPDAATPPLFSDATGTGAFQVQGALALEQVFGPWLVNATGIVAKRTEHGGETLGTQVTFLAAGAYTFPNDVVVALSASYAFEGDAGCDAAGAGLCPAGSSTVPQSGKSSTVVTASGLWPFADAWRVLGGLSLTPPATSFGANQPATGGLTLTLVRSWT